jgi:hypothetical protein
LKRSQGTLTSFLYKRANCLALLSLTTVEATEVAPIGCGTIFPVSYRGGVSGASTDILEAEEVVGCNSISFCSS